MTVARWPGLQRLEFSATDPLLAREFLDRTYGGRLLVKRCGDFSAALTYVDAGSFAVSDVALPADLTFEGTGRDDLIVSTVRAGTAQIDQRKVTDRYQRGDVHIGNCPQAGFVGHAYRHNSHNFTLPMSLLYAVAEHAPSAPLRFLSPHPVSAAARTQWLNISAYVDSVLASSEAASSLLIIQNIARLLAATALAVFPNTGLGDLTAPDHCDASTATLRRAIAFIDEHAERDIGVTDIAAAASVTIRAVQLSFRRNLDITPLGYLRRARLARAHRDLLDADPGHESVATVAYQWGFSSPSRFAAAYRRAYGIAPSRTLRQG